MKDSEGLRVSPCPCLAAIAPELQSGTQRFGPKKAVAEIIIFYETDKIRTTTIVEGIVHPFGTCMEGFEVVCNVSNTVMLAIPAETQPQSPQTESCQRGLRGQAAYVCEVP